MSNHQDIIDALAKESSVVFINKNSSAAKKVKSIVEFEFISPTVLFLYDGKKTWSSNPDIILAKLEGFIEEMTFVDFFLSNMDKIPKNQTEDIIEDSNQSNYQMIEKQKRELEEAEHQFELAKQKEIQKKLEKEKAIKEQNLKETQQREKSEKKKNKKENLPLEPSSDDPSSVNIRFRLPDGNTTERRFLNTSKVQILYDYIDTLDYIFENECSKYDLIEPFPFKSYNNLDSSLKDCGIVNNTLLQIREL